MKLLTRACLALLSTSTIFFAKDVAIASTFSLQSEAVKSSSQSFCAADLSRWQSLISHRPSTYIQRELSQRNASWHIHPIENAQGDINLDYYSVIIDRLPPNMSAGQLLYRMRLNINQFVNYHMAVFSPYAQADRARWNSTHPLGSVISIDLGGPDNASVVTSDNNNQSWIFSTIETTQDGSHPVSGNRRFGYFEWNGSLVFYTRGADRATNGLYESVSDGLFFGGDQMWRGFQQRLAYMVNTSGGSARIGRTVSHRCNWNNVRSRYYNPSTPWL